MFPSIFQKEETVYFPSFLAAVKKLNPFKKQQIQSLTPTQY